MKYLLSENTIDLANKVAKHKWLKKLLKTPYYWYKNYLAKKRNKYFQKNALRVLSIFDKALQEDGIFYTLAFGTLLGAIREKGFIKHDVDIDVFMWAEDWSQATRDCLLGNGFKLLHCFEVDNGVLGREETYEMDGISIDVFYVYPAIDKYPYCCDFLFPPKVASFKQSIKQHGGLIVRRIEMPLYKKRIRASFEDLSLFVPENSHELLSFRYGPGYMIPNPDWTINSFDDHIVVWAGKLGVIHIYNE